MPTQTADRHQTITLTERAPARIVEAEWPLIAHAEGDSWAGGANKARRARALKQGKADRWWLRVRQHADGRSIVYGRYQAGIRSDKEDWEGGEVLDGADRHQIPETIQRVGMDGQIPDGTIRRCVASLPAVDL